MLRRELAVPPAQKELTTGGRTVRRLYVRLDTGCRCPAVPDPLEVSERGRRGRLRRRPPVSRPGAWCSASSRRWPRASRSSTRAPTLAGLTAATGGWLRPRTPRALAGRRRERRRAGFHAV